ncbi:MAG: hypothetical protein KZQ64_08710 [gamma proteobacterium symbiont of Bathyaustriella thionipta]|nr:hypothetical protein [gamma proteobacterium symbiont of Bathyaustriella thionipta]MCU7948989.1 hypothetical protein [gamma proteobacterium symbiont of Bathyaustriella thionipta]MCU7953453.1 hypothetical protein [gamma proteobacterium symbiont of Bathyaustriella thionipta]MCU7955553.1 hypothetical protein [gamma proteobacterium symbiont of Bathyaustriella thionipta]MCU7967354.1 hypothetical protein [gamma proteobacterium symbiont of Bathyaustriella thionipta]
MYKCQRDNIGQKLFSKAVYRIIFTLSLFMLFTGVYGIIEHKSPDNLSSLMILGSGFITYFEYHALIIFGALCFTFSICFMRNE